MPTLGLSQIVKNEAHVIGRMLESILPILDYVAIVDTGSTDNTPSIIKKICKKHRVPCKIIERPFDNFGESRNAAMKLLGTKTAYGIWLDADETLEIGKDFSKKSLIADLYVLPVRYAHKTGSEFTRREIWKTSDPFFWWGPCHEVIAASDESKLKKEYLTTLHVVTHNDGGSWKTSSDEKYMQQALMLEEYLAKDRGSRWLFYTARSFENAAYVPDNPEENARRLKKSLEYYKERASVEGVVEEKYVSLWHIGLIMQRLNEPWPICREALLEAYNFDPLRGDSFDLIIKYHQHKKEGEIAYLYSRFAKETFHNHNPYPDHRHIEVHSSFYQWQFLEMHLTSCLMTGRIDEAMPLYAELLEISNTHPEYFTAEQIQNVICCITFKNLLQAFRASQEWPLMYHYSKFIKEVLGIVSALDPIDPNRYSWNLLELHAMSCGMTGRMDEARSTQQLLLDILNAQPQLFNDIERNNIIQNAVSMKLVAA